MFRFISTYYVVTCAVVFKLIIPTAFAQSPNFACDPFEIGSISETIEDPSRCSCTMPCTEDKVVENLQFLYIKRGQQTYRRLDEKNPMSSELFNYKYDVKFLIHGFSVTATEGWIQPTGKQLTNTFNGYVIAVDFGYFRNCTYEITVLNIAPAVANYMTKLIKDFNFDLNKIEIIGHSLGAQISGQIGASFHGAIRKITALDPAGPGFDDNPSIGVNKTCAQYVQVLHTNSGGLGTTKLRGDADFFANNHSAFQPGCTYRDCGHIKAVYYYYASLFGQNKFIAGSCSNFDTHFSTYIHVFNGPFNDKPNGIFCFQTTSCFPYAVDLGYEKKIRAICNNCKSKSKKKIVGN